MQGFNKYYPPDFDWRTTATLNEARGKHALGDRARKIDQGVLIVRFELPFNVWCGSCNGHIGAGVRYNAEKKKVGNYLSTPIFGFRCKCAHCQNWFEIRTDPKNAAYVVHEGAKKQESEWDADDYGGYGAHDPDNPSTAAADAFSQLEKTTTQLVVAKTAEERLIDLYAYSARTTEDPETLNKRLRSTFRGEKKVRVTKEGRDDALREKYGLADSLDLGDEGASGSGSSEWKEERDERERRLLLAGRALLKGKSRDRQEGSVDRLKRTVLSNSANRFHPFAPSSSSSSTRSRLTGQTILPPPKSIPKPKKVKTGPLEPTGGLVDYESD